MGLMRIGIGGILLLDIFIRLSDLSAHYTDQGTLPLSVLHQHLWNDWFISFHNISSSKGFLVTLFLIQALAAFSLLIGYRTRLATFISWILLLSVHNRNPMILQGGDDLLRMILFWCMFIPWGTFYSIENRSADIRFFGAGSFGLIAQISAVYFFSAMLKSSGEWRSESTALYYALSLDQMVLPLGKLIYPYEGLLKVLTWIVFRVELYVPFLLLIPIENTRFRNIAAVIFIFFHLGIGLTLFVGLFFLIGIVSSIGLLGGSFADKIHSYLMRFNLKFKIQKPVLIKARENRYAGSFRTSREILLVATLIYIMIWNFETTNKDLKLIPKEYKGPGYALRINQNWGMFAPCVFKDDGWYLFEARTVKGELIDLNRFGKPLDQKKPEAVVTLFRNDRWRKFSENYLFVSNAYLRPYYCNFILKQWNQEHPENKVDTLRVVYMKEVSGAGYQHAIPKREILSEAVVK